MKDRARSSTNIAFLANARTAGVRFHATINDYIVLDGRDGEDLVRSTKLNAFLLEGRNVLAVHASEGDALRTRLDLELVVGEQERPETRHVSWSYQLEAAPHALPAEPAELARHEFFVERGLPPWGWERARPFRGDVDLPEIGALLMEARSAAERRDIEGLLALFEMSLREQAVATARTPEAATGLMRSVFGQFIGDPGFVLYMADGMMAESWAGGRLVRVRGDGALPPISLVAPPLAFHLEMVVSCIDGRWLFVR